MFLLGFLLPAGILAQVSWQEKPQDQQLVPRNEQNFAFVRFAGEITDTSVHTLSLVRQTASLQDTLALHRSSTQQPFSFLFRDTLWANLNKHDYFLWAGTGAQATLLWQCSNVVCGDVYIVAGQSNALALLPPDSIMPVNPFVRTFGRVNDAQTADVARDTVWGTARAAAPDTNLHLFVGYLGWHFGDSLVKRFGVPVAVINVARGATAIALHQKQQGPEDLSRIYDRMLYRCRKAGVPQSVKAVLWYQGESDMSTLTLDYTKQFAQLYSSWKLDFPGLQQVCVYQIGHGCGNFFSSGLREEMRHLDGLDPGHIHILSTMNIPTDGCHYYPEGYAMLSRQAVALAARDFFGEMPQPWELAPDLQRAFYQSPRRLHLEFDQPVEVEQFSNGHWIGDYLSNEWDMMPGVTAVYSKENALVLETVLPYAFSRLSYTPECYYTNTTEIYKEPYIHNAQGLRALTFHAVQVPISMPDELLEQIAVAPNPFYRGNRLSIYSLSPYLILDLSGRPMSVEDLQPGIYVVRNQTGAAKKLLVR